ncbi:MAG: SprT-like domain-containing protein [Lachnospiraceae bacterium]|nr:SprT-like domain-containing protein [Lachnospiraceae bacterium]
MDQVSNGRDYEQQLTHLFNLFNKRFWKNELPEVIITFVPTRGAHGHVTSVPVWVSDKDSKYELNISALTINRSPEDICETILHEQCHLYNLMHDIKDCSNMGRYHNVRFKKTAMEHGLNVEHHDRYGWAITTLNSEAIAYIKRLNLKKFEFRRATGRAKKHTLMRYACPVCGKDGPFCYVSSHQLIICGTCESAYLEYSPTEKEQ